MLKFSVSERT